MQAMHEWTYTLDFVLKTKEKRLLQHRLNRLAEKNQSRLFIFKLFISVEARKGSTIQLKLRFLKNNQSLVMLKSISATKIFQS